MSKTKHYSQEWAELAQRQEQRIAELEKQRATTQEQLDRFMSAHAEALVRIAELEQQLHDSCAESRALRDAEGFGAGGAVCPLADQYEQRIAELEARLTTARQAWWQFIEGSYHHKDAAWHMLTDALKEQ